MMKRWNWLVVHLSVLSHFCPRHIHMPQGPLHVPSPARPASSPTPHLYLDGPAEATGAPCSCMTDVRWCRETTFWGLLFFGCLLSWSLRCCVAADSNGTSSTRRRLQEEGMGEGHVEGCFDRFDALFEIPLEANLIGLHNNRRCQAACGAQGYALAATRSDPLGCLCGNDYPSAFHQMDAGKCNAPCNPDHASCLLTTCCGSRDGQLFTVSFTGRQNILLQVLRQLVIDYRTSAPTFRRKIEESFVDSSALQVVNSNAEHSLLVAGRPCSGSTTNAAVNTWFQDSCYSLHWASRLNYADAERQCQEENHDARVAVPASAEENQFVTRLQCGCQGWLGIDTASIGNPNAGQQPQHYQNWTASAAASQAGPCAQLRADGAWVKRPCTQHEGLLTDDADDDNGSDYVAGAVKAYQGGNCFVCKRSRRQGDDKAVTLAATSAAPSDTWRLECVADGDHPNELMVRMRHDPTGSYLACNPGDGGLHIVGSGEAGTATFVAGVNEENGSFTLRQHSLYVALLENNNLACLDVGKEEERGHVGATAPPSAAVFKPTCMLRILAARFLRLSIVTLSNDLHYRGRRECSVAVYDTTPSTASFRCRPAPLPAGSGPTAGDELWLEQQALLVSDQSRWLQPRTPLPFGRLRCINEHPRQSAICTLAYGQGFTVARALTIDWNYIIFDTITVRANIQAALQTTFRYQGFAGTGDEDGNESELTWAATKEWANDFTVVFNNFYELAVVYAHVETRNWQMTMLALPLTTHTVQFWLEVVMLRYRWRALFQARGSFRVMYFDQSVGAQHDVGDVSNYDDIFFYIFGRYDFPVEASLITTLNNLQERSWPVALPTTSMVEEGAGVRQPGRPTGFPR